jgi:hypothetical protein
VQQNDGTRARLAAVHLRAHRRRDGAFGVVTRAEECG